MNLTDTSGPRPYRQTARAEAAAETHRRILEAFRDEISRRWFDEVRLEDVARTAKVTVQTVIRRFGNKEGLIAELAGVIGDDVRIRRATEAGNVDTAIAALMVDYEAVGDFLWRLLAQEDRFPVLSAALNIGRAGHRDWLATVFAAALDGGGEGRLDALVAATDLYVWKLLRRDLGLAPDMAAAAMRRLIQGALS